MRIFNLVIFRSERNCRVFNFHTGWCNHMHWILRGTFTTSPVVSIKQSLEWAYWAGTPWKQLLALKIWHGNSLEKKEKKNGCANEYTHKLFQVMKHDISEEKQKSKLTLSMFGLCHLVAPGAKSTLWSEMDLGKDCAGLQVVLLNCLQ